jgi:NADH-quinone oxidoreductase subunit H
MSTELIVALIKANIVLGVLLTNTILLIWFERKLVAGMQSRVGPDRAGPFGILQTVADAIKNKYYRLKLIGQCIFLHQLLL